MTALAVRQRSPQQKNNSIITCVRVIAGIPTFLAPLRYFHLHGRACHCGMTLDYEAKNTITEARAMTKGLWIAAALAVATGGTFAAQHASAHWVTQTDWGPGNTASVPITHDANRKAVIYAGVDIAGNVTNTSFTMATTGYANMRIRVRNYCNSGAVLSAEKASTGLYDAVVSPACPLSGVWVADGSVTD
jgi:hypothetical protein